MVTVKIQIGNINEELKSVPAPSQDNVLVIDVIKLGC